MVVLLSFFTSSPAPVLQARGPPGGFTLGRISLGTLNQRGYEERDIVKRGASGSRCLLITIVRHKPAQ